MVGIAEIGHFTLSMALASAIIMAVLPMIGASQNNTGRCALARHPVDAGANYDHLWSSDRIIHHF